MPSVAGASTLTNPGNITSFRQLRFLAQYTPAISGTSFSVIIECYPEMTCGPGQTAPCYPRVFYSFTPSEGTTFREVDINLSQPSYVDAPSTVTLQDLLSQTRFMSLYAYASVGIGPPQTLVFDVDDIQFVPPAPAEVRSWQDYQ